MVILLERRNTSDLIRKKSLNTARATIFFRVVLYCLEMYPLPIRLSKLMGLSKSSNHIYSWWFYQLEFSSSTLCSVFVVVKVNSCILLYQKTES